MASLELGTLLGRYRIEGPLGAGGMGEVYRAFDPTLCRSLAIKVLGPDGGEALGARSLIEEARNASALNHPNICVVYEAGQHDGKAFIAMELVEGQSLKGLIIPGGLDMDSVLRYAGQVADALAHAHRRGVVHGDLKAANIIARPDGHLKVVDFGLARRLPREQDVTLSLRETLDGVGLAGTAYAMAPEQVRGQRATTRADVWAFGVLMVEMLSGHQPFEGSSLADLFSAILRDAPRSMGAHVPHRLALFVDRCLQKDSEARFADGQELLAALRLEQAALSGGQAASPGVLSDNLPLPVALSLSAVSGAFSGRRKELDQLRAAWESACLMRRRVVLMAGEPGIGKTRLCQEFASTCVREGALVLWGRSGEEALVAYQPFVEALGWYVRSCEERELRSQMRAVGQGAELAAFLPDLQARLGDVASPERTDAEAQRYRTFQATSDFLASLSRSHPVLLVLDDLHWADRPTLLLLKHIARDTNGCRLCIVGTFRDTELGRASPLGDLLADLRREDNVERISLRGLGLEEVKALVETGMGGKASRTFIGMLAGATAGNPFFIGEIIRHLREKGALNRTSMAGSSFDDLGLPDGVREVVGRRLSHLGVECNRVLSLASVVGREFPLDMLARLAGQSEESLLDLLDRAVRARIVSEKAASPGRFSFAHDLIRHTLYEEITPSRRVRLHKRVAEVLEHLAGAKGPSLPEMAYHCVQAGPVGDIEKAIDYAVRAGEQAGSGLAHEEAARFYEMALSLLEHLPGEDRRRALAAEIHGRRGRAFQEVGLWAEAESELREALELLPADEELVRCEILLDLLLGSFWLFALGPVEVYAKEALDLARRLGRRDLEAEATAMLAILGQARDGDLHKAVRVFGEALHMAREAPPRRRASSLAQAPLTLYLAGNLDNAVIVGSEIAERARALCDSSYFMQAMSAYGISLAGRGNYAEAERVFEETLAFGRRYGVWSLLARAISMSAGFKMELGDFKTAEALQQEAHEMALGASFRPAVISTGIDLLFLSARSGEPARAEPLLPMVSQAVQEGRGSHAWLWGIRFRQAQAELALARGDHQEAILAAADVRRLSARCHRRKYEALALLASASALDAKGRTHAALDDLRHGLRVAQKMGDPALTLRLIAPLLARDGDESLASEAMEVVRSIDGALSDSALRARFLDSAPARTVLRLSG